MAAGPAADQHQALFRSRIGQPIKDIPELPDQFLLRANYSLKPVEMCPPRGFGQTQFLHT
jgi:hypothetical protein